MPTRSVARTSTTTVPPLDEAEVEIVEQASLALLELTLAALGQVRSVSVLQLRALTTIDRHAPMNLSSVAERLDLSIPSASRLVDRLVEAGLTRREVAAHSRREVSIVLSANGRRALTRLRRRRQAAMAAVLEGMTAADRDALGVGLAAFTAAADALIPTPEG